MASQKPQPKHKEKYRQTNAKHWCEYCRVFVFNSDLAKKKHDASPQHKDAMKRFVGRIEREERDKARLLAKAGIPLADERDGSVNKNNQQQTASFYTNRKPEGKPLSLLSVRAPTSIAGEKTGSGSLPGAIPRALAINKTIQKEPEQPAISDSNKIEAFMAQAAIVGQWEEVQPTPAPPSGPSKKVVEDEVGEDFLKEKTLPDTLAEGDGSIDPAIVVTFAKRTTTQTARSTMRKK